MALLHLDGFDHYATGDITESWTQIYTGAPASEVAVVPAIGRRGTSGLRFGVGEGNYSGTPAVAMAGLGTTRDTAIVGFAFAHTGTAASWGKLERYGIYYFHSVRPDANYVLGNSVQMLVGIREGGYTQVCVVPNSNGTLSVIRCGNDQGRIDMLQELLGVTTQALMVQEVYYIELKVKISETAGTVDLRVNGDVWLSVSGVNTQNPDHLLANRWDEVVFGQIRGGAASNYYWDFDDLYIADDDASNVDNHVVDFLGDIGLTWRLPQADGAMRDCTPAPGPDRYANVDDVPPDDDTTINSTATVGAIDTFIIEDAPLTASIVAMAVVHSSRRTTHGDTSTASVVRIGGGNYAGAARGNTSTYSYTQTIWTKKPTDHTAITVADFNAMEVGYKKVS